MERKRPWTVSVAPFPGDPLAPELDRHLIEMWAQPGQPAPNVVMLPPQPVAVPGKSMWLISVGKREAAERSADPR